ncbi:MAG TPA: CHC2 zinc finger domain-containing protein [Acidobacteriaceae bacterium]|jgi:hypothetical protein|nr:CHC2 zinc finger domain-containing protein [Acidobacteriaceae bacterium]
MERTGYSVNVITEAVRVLKDEDFIEQSANWEKERRKKRARFAVCEYTLLDGAWRLPLVKQKGQNLLFSNRVNYFRFPEAVIREKTERWSLAKMSSSEVRVYVGCLIMLESIRRLDKPTIGALRKIVDLDSRTVGKALDGLDSHGLIWTSGSNDSFKIELCDPYTGTPLEPPGDDAEIDPANFFRKDPGGVFRRVSFNMTPPETEAFIRSVIPAGEPVLTQNNGELMICCPFHDDSNPSCSVSPAKHGIFHCYACEEGGTMFKLAAALTDSSRRAAIEMVAKARGLETEFREPDAKAQAIYRYRNEKGELQKQVLRFEIPDGTKRFLQRRWLNGGWKYDVKGLPPLLYNRDRLIFADTVFLVEGEKDADTATSFSLISSRGRAIVGVTSGGANSWDARLATHLRGYRVVLMPDDDDAGRSHADAVRKSLDAERISYREISFAGTGAKDLTDYIADHKARDLIRMIGGDWVRLPDGSSLDSDDDPMALIQYGPLREMREELQREITI